ncbi:unnamed protein product [Diabrotica balteata]|uniref:Uncharacterized protein n=1 Tax=Diabrotica balteata TaxID=107213 RepID=A0A9N9SWG0_DIABA|nr:unnamed protein product [Diabrotica balteata]
MMKEMNTTQKDMKQEQKEIKTEIREIKEQQNKTNEALLKLTVENEQLKKNQYIRKENSEIRRELREINEDIKVAMLQMVNVVRVTGDKLEKHEQRDRVLGEQLKKGLINIDKRIKTLDPVKGTIARLEERLAAFETILMQMNEKEKKQLQMTFEAVINIQKNLPVVMEEMKNEIISKISVYQSPSQISPPVILKEDFEKMKKEIMDKIYIVTNSIEKIENEIDKINKGNQQTKNLENLNIYFNKSQELFTKFDKNLDNCNSKISNKKDEEWKLNVITASNGQQSDVKNILTGIKLLQNKIDQLSQNYDLAIDQNFSSQKQDKFTSELINYIKKTHQDTIKKLNDLSELTVNLLDSFVTSKIQNLNRLDNFKTSILDLENRALVNATSKIEEDIQQLLQKIGVMDQQMKSNADSLKQLENCKTGTYNIDCLLTGNNKKDPSL